MRIALLGLLAVLLSGIVGIQLLAAMPLIPDGNRLFVVGGHMLGAGAMLGTLALLYLIPKANRTLPSYLKAFVALGAMFSLSQCTTWHARFNGPPKEISDPATRITLVAPSDWAIVRDTPPNVDFALSDWAGTKGVTVTRGEELPTDLPPDDAVAGILEAQREQAAVRMGAPVDRFQCGPHCAGDVFLAEARGKRMRMYAAAKVHGRTLILVQATGMTGTGGDDPAELLGIVRSVRTADP